jgi:hypothetical protein
MSLIFAPKGEKLVPCWVETGCVLKGGLLEEENFKYVITNEDAIAHVKKMTKAQLDPLLKLFCPDLQSTRKTPVEILRDYVVIKMKDVLQKTCDKASAATSETKGASASASIISEPQDEEEPDD